MKANSKDFRIGNLVNFGSRFYVVDKIEKEFVTIVNPKRENNYAILDYDSISGIELTEEWLLKLGFEKDHLYFSKGSFHYHTHGIIFIGNDHVSSGHVDSYLKTVHQLQNLFFSLCGEELKIK